MQMMIDEISRSQPNLVSGSLSSFLSAKSSRPGQARLGKKLVEEYYNHDLKPYDNKVIDRLFIQSRHPALQELIRQVTIDTRSLIFPPCRPFKTNDIHNEEPTLNLDPPS